MVVARFSDVFLCMDIFLYMQAYDSSASAMGMYVEGDEMVPCPSTYLSPVVVPEGSQASVLQHHQRMLAPVRGVHLHTHTYGHRGGGHVSHHHHGQQKASAGNEPARLSHVITSDTMQLAYLSTYSPTCLHVRLPAYYLYPPACPSTIAPSTHLRSSLAHELVDYGQLSHPLRGAQATLAVIVVARSVYVSRPCQQNRVLIACSTIIITITTIIIIITTISTVTIVGVVAVIITATDNRNSSITSTSRARNETPMLRIKS